MYITMHSHCCYSLDGTISFLAISKGMIMAAAPIISAHSCKVKPTVLKKAPPRYVKVTCTMNINATTPTNPLFSEMRSKRFKLGVLTLKALKFVRKIKKAKKAVKNTG